jgi:hypothetical protein
MRLLQRCSDSEFSLTENLGDEDELTPYAILSHTWRVDGDEVTFEDLRGSTGKAKPGYETALVPSRADRRALCLLRQLFAEQCSGRRFCYFQALRSFSHYRPVMKLTFH